MMALNCSIFIGNLWRMRALNTMYKHLNNDSFINFRVKDHETMLKHLKNSIYYFKKEDCCWGLG